MSHLKAKKDNTSSLMEQAIKNAENGNYLFVSTKEEQEALAIMKSMDIRITEVDLSEDSEDIL